ncbi:MAG: Gfo/Idh/MocA family oxidoreductase [Chloroflexi bacterium]|nr:Gfo/Idh/MocA family oxidoreductase [Chloroflexota bacterium]
MDRVRVAVLGLGWPGQRHLEAYLKQSDVEVVVIADANPALLAQTLAASGVRRGCASYEEALALADVDAVSICLPNALHAPAAIAALEAGRHVLCEKPLARTVAEGEQIAAAVARSGRVFMMALPNRFRPENLALKRLVDTGGLGEIYYARAGWLRRVWNPIVRGWFIQRELSGGGPLIDLGVHMLDLALWYMGNPAPAAVSGVACAPFRERVAARVGPIDTEDFASALVRLSDGRAVAIEASWVGHTEHQDHVFCALLGDRGGANVERFAGQTSLKVFTEPVESLPLTATPVGLLDGTASTLASFAAEVRHFVDCVREGWTPSAPVQHGLDILRILDATYRSAALGREVIIDGG